MQIIENDSDIIYEGKKLRFDTTEGIQRAEAFIRMKEVLDFETGLRVPRTKVSFCYNSLSPKAPSEPFVMPCIEGRGRKKKGENIMTHVVMRFPCSVCVPIPVRTQATRTVKGSDPITAKIALEIAKKWVKVTYGNIDYMCGIHIDQPDMLVHFLLFIKDTKPQGEENARKLFLAYHLDKFIPELAIENEPVSDENPISQEAELEEVSAKNISKTDFKGENYFSEKENQAEEMQSPAIEIDKAVIETKLSKAHPEGTTVPKNATTRDEKQKNKSTKKESEIEAQIEKEKRDVILSQIKQETIYASKPSERKDQLDIASIVARVRASSEFAKEKEEIVDEKNEEIEVIEPERVVVVEEKEPKEAPVYIDPIAQIKANAVNQIFGLKKVLDPMKESTAISEEQDEIKSIKKTEFDKQEETTAEQEAESKDNINIESEMLINRETENHMNENIKTGEEINSDIEKEEKKIDLAKEGTYLEKLGKSEDEMLYDESEYAKTPIGTVSWGTELEEEEFKEEKKVQAVFSSRNLSVIAEGNNSYDDDFHEELPEISFFVQNEAGEKEVPEEFQYEPSPRALQQRDAAASYVKGLKRAKTRKIVFIILGLLVLAAEVSYYLFLK